MDALKGEAMGESRKRSRETVQNIGKKMIYTFFILLPGAVLG